MLFFKGTSPQESIQSPIDDSTIMEETETAEGQLQAPSEPSGDVHEPFSRHKATLRLQRGSRRRSRRSLYRARESGPGNEKKRAKYQTLINIF